MAQLGDTVITGSLAVSNCIYGSVTCATCSTTSTNACKGWNGSAFATFGSNAFTSITKVSQLTNDSGFTSNAGTVTSIKFQCGGTDKCTVTASGTINLSANAWNTNATISITTYPGACCTGTLTSTSGCAYDSARLGGTVASSYALKTGCVCCAQYLLNSGGTTAYKVWIVV